MDNVKIVKIITGEMLCGQVRQEADYVVLTKPLYVQIAERGTVLMDIFAFLTKDEELKIPLTQVIFQINPAENVYDAYRKAVSPIDLVTKPKLVNI